MPYDIDHQELRLAVTGGTAGLGLALVRQLAASGARVAFIARTPEAVERTAAETGAADDAALAAASAALAGHHYRDHEFGDSVLVERGPGAPETAGGEAAVYAPLTSVCEWLI